MRRLCYYVATTVDGFIAHPDRTVDWFVNEGPHAADYLASLKQDYEIVLMGRHTYEFGFQFGVTNPYPWLKQYVFSQTMERSPDPHVELVSAPVIEFVSALKSQTGKAIYLCGGAELATTLFGAGLIDEIILKVNPVVFGAGIPLFSAVVKTTDLELTSSKVYENGVILLNYTVKR